MAQQRLPDAELLEDLCTRFILNVPANELESFEKLMFLVEQAHWFYEDFFREKDSTLRSLSLKAFTGLLFQRCPGLARFAEQRDAIYARFTAFKHTVPVMGAIMLEPRMKKCLLVKGWQASASWGFPRGKISKDETDLECAIREVKEETGFDISGKVAPQDFIEVHVKQQRSKLYIVTGVNEQTRFAPECKKEISAFAWHVIVELPCTPEASSLTYQTADGARHKFFMVWPYIKQLQKWIKQRRRQLSSVDVNVSAGPQSLAAPAACAIDHPRPNDGPKIMKANGTKHAGSNASAQSPAVPPPPPGELSPHLPNGYCTRSHALQLSAARAPQPNEAGPEGGGSPVGSCKGGPAETKHVHAPAEPGQAWQHFAFDRAAIAQSLHAWPSCLAPAR